MSLNLPIKHTRTDRINKIKILYKQHSKNSDWNVIIAKFCVEEGVSLRTAHEYLRLLHEAGEIE